VVAELERICDYLIVLRAGRVRLAGDIEQLRQTHRIVSGPAGWSQPGSWPVINSRTTAGQTIALVRSDASTLCGPGLDEAQPTFEELVLGYLDEDPPTREEALA
jgi:ABC-2 type transport system ATP-binding protein